MASRKKQMFKESSNNVTNVDEKRRKTQRSQESLIPREISTRKKRKITLENTKMIDLLTKKRERREESDDEETSLRDRLLDEIDSLGSLSQSSESRASNKEASSGGESEENSNGETTFVQDRKIIKLKGRLPNLALPEGWLALNHRSGGIIYIHRPSRVCTWSRPYYIGKGSVRKHDVPIAAIPCLHQRKALETESINSLQKHPSEHLAQSQVIGSSVLNFINTAGALSSNGSQTTQCQSEISRVDFSGSQARGQIDNDVSTSSPGGTNEVDGASDSSKDDSVMIVSPSLPEDDNEVSIKSDGGFTATGDDATMAVTKSKSSVFGENDGSGHTHGLDHGTRKKVDDEKSALQYDYKEYDSGIGGEGGGSDTIGSSTDAEKTDDTTAHQSGNCNQDERFHCQYIFHPKDGLDVVNDNLKVQPSLQKTQNYHFKQYESENPISGSELESSTVLETTLKESTDSASKPCNPTEVKINNSEKVKRKEKISKSVEPDECKMGTNMSSKTNTVDQKLVPKCVTTESKTGLELIDSEELGVYLGKLFEFEEVTYEQEQNVTMATGDQPTELEESSMPALLECLPYCVKGVNARQNKEWVLNPGGKTPSAILHEYSQAVLKKNPVYVCSECDNPSAPFMAEVQIDGITHGTGQASSKKQAKQAAAEATLQVFLPDFFKKIRDYHISPKEFEYFDKLEIDHPNVYEVSIKLGLPSPSQLLQECLKRNQGVCSQIIDFKIIPGENQDHSYKISCGKHTAEGSCKNKKTGKQLASQALLKKLHPYVSTWGSLLRIYCDRPSSIVKKYKTAEDDVLHARQHSSSGDTPRGEFLLARLKEEMKKIADEGKQNKKSRSRSKTYTKDNPISTVDI